MTSVYFDDFQSFVLMMELQDFAKCESCLDIQTKNARISGCEGQENFIKKETLYQKLTSDG